jgi:hypothetical protein
MPFLADSDEVSIVRCAIQAQAKPALHAWKWNPIKGAIFSPQNHQITSFSSSPSSTSNQQIPFNFNHQHHPNPAEQHGPKRVHQLLALVTSSHNWRSSSTRCCY